MDNITYEYWKRKLKEYALGIFIVISILGILSWIIIYIAGDKTIETTDIQGNLVGFHQEQHYTGSTRSVFVVILENGQKVSIYPNRGTPFKKGQTVNIKQQNKESGRISYYFDGYINETANKSLNPDALR